jgi:hypothetical protein
LLFESLTKILFKSVILARYQWFTLVILATGKAEIGKMRLEASPGQIFSETPSPT